MKTRAEILDECLTCIRDSIAQLAPEEMLAVTMSVEQIVHIYLREQAAKVEVTRSEIVKH